MAEDTVDVVLDASRPARGAAAAPRSCAARRGGFQEPAAGSRRRPPRRPLRHAAPADRGADRRRPAPRRTARARASRTCAPRPFIAVRDEMATHLDDVLLAAAPARRLFDRARLRPCRAAVAALLGPRARLDTTRPSRPRLRRVASRARGCMRVSETPAASGRDQTFRTPRTVDGD